MLATTGEPPPRLEVTPSERRRVRPRRPGCSGEIGPAGRVLRKAGKGVRSGETAVCGLRFLQQQRTGSFPCCCPCVWSLAMEGRAWAWQRCVCRAEVAGLRPDCRSGDALCSDCEYFVSHACQLATPRDPAMFLENQYLSVEWLITKPKNIIYIEVSLK